ncbi:PH domain-containing protein [Pseudonocardia sp. MH-G8]|uniref:PH domain-containing protein n=1 Tax=Pseudonocardia sp. MH-G8 TaxID=1854588 RepID=UPI001E32DDA1|nr:PH domain-containing protein [Pseudonocardia sp. MH-G8]
MSTPEEGWQELDRRTVAVTALLALGGSIAAGLPIGISIARNTSAGTALLWVLPATVLLVVGASVLDLVRWRRTRYRITPGRVELRTGILVATHRSLQRDRIRAVDVTADPLLRAFGLVAVRVGTGEQSGAGEGSVALRPVPAAAGAALRRELLDRAHTTAPADGVLAALDPAWIRYAPMSFLAPVLGASAFAGALQVSEWFGLEEGVIAWVGSLFHGVPIVAMIAVLTVIALVVGAVAALALWVEMWWNYRLERQPGTLHVSRGLLTTRSISVEEARLRGVEFVEPLGVRLAGAARVDAVATGLGSAKPEEDKTDRRTLLPAAPRAVAQGVAATVLREAVSPTDAVRLTGHPTAARGRRLRWALGAVVVVEAPLVLLGALLTDVLLHIAWISAVVLVPVAVVLALDAYRSLGHGLGERYLVTRSGSVRRTTVALQRGGIIGWTFRQSIFQRRAHLVTVIATTAAGTGAYAVPDAGSDDGLELAAATVPGLLVPFLEPVGEAVHRRTAAVVRSTSPVASTSSSAPRNVASTAVGSWSGPSTSPSSAIQSSTPWTANPAHGPSGSTSERA